MKKNNKQKKGFTLIELLVVIAIIAVLAAVIVATTTGAQVQARDSRRVSDLEALRTALELYYNKYGYYPKYGTSSEETLSSTAGTTGGVLLSEGFLSAVPTDPINSGNYLYKYCGTTDGSKYAIKANLEMKDNKALQSDIDTDYPGVVANVCNCDQFSDTASAAPYTYCLRNP